MPNRSRAATAGVLLLAVLAVALLWRGGGADHPEAVPPPAVPSQAPTALPRATLPPVLPEEQDGCADAGDSTVVARPYAVPSPRARGPVPSPLLMACPAR